jgi:DNA-binding PadR family transcriptional regulator
MAFIEDVSAGRALHFQPYRYYLVSISNVTWNRDVGMVRRKDGKVKPQRDPESMLPLKSQWLHVMLAVAAGHRHGYAIRQEVEERTAGRIRLWPATLYGALAQLTETGLLEEVDDGSALVESDDARRRYYRLTADGRAVLAAETRRLEELVRYARSSRVLGTRG